ncbi:MAG: hypothetical protein CM1200mP18_14120 [Gammaproteobacteria bacterium]|nr:MAG: hypothetical protein CM1200mP18_14120 [Gammaproteobacteria bacterium]
MWLLLWNSWSTSHLQPKPFPPAQSLPGPGGPVFFSTINRNLKSWLFAIVGAGYVLNLFLVENITTKSSLNHQNWIYGPVMPVCT